jgi:hypothetical protein
MPFRILNLEIARLREKIDHLKTSRKLRLAVMGSEK